jgi:hypothetical protein
MDKKEIESVFAASLKTIDGEEFFVFEAPKITPPELRLYYDENGKVVTYSCDKLEGNYIIVDPQTFAECRYDVRVIDGKLSKVNPSLVIYKLKPNNTEGTYCAVDDICVIVDEDYTDKQLWKLHAYELRSKL